MFTVTATVTDLASYYSTRISCQITVDVRHLQIDRNDFMRWVVTAYDASSFAERNMKMLANERDHALVREISFGRLFHLDHKRIIAYFLKRLFFSLRGDFYFYVHTNIRMSTNLQMATNILDLHICSHSSPKGIAIRFQSLRSWTNREHLCKD